MSHPIPRFVIVRASAGIFGMALLAAGIYFGIRYFQHQTEALDKLEAAREEIAEAARKESDGKSPNAPASRIDAAASPSHGDGYARRVAIASENALAAFNQKAQDYRTVYEEFKESGMVRSSTLPSLESVHERQEMLKRFEAANIALENIFQNVPETARLEFQKQGLSEQQSKKWAASFAQRANVDALLAMRAGDRELVLEFGKILELLDHSWGTWKPGANDKVIFDNPEEARTYNALRAQILEINNRQQALQAEALAKAQSIGSAAPKHPVRYDQDFIGPVP